MRRPRYHVEVSVNALVVMVEDRARLNRLADAIDAEEGLRVTETRMFYGAEQGSIVVYAERREGESAADVAARARARIAEAVERFYEGEVL